MNNPLLNRSSRIVRNVFLCRQCRRWASQGRVFKAGDKVIVKKIDSKEDDGWMFTLQASQKIQSHKGFIPHQEIIGRPSGALVRSHKGAQFRVFEPSLAEYVTLSSRLVTPIYPDDANLIVNLLDLHPPASDDTSYRENPLQILEVGTGQGSLTLHIAKAIHGYNEKARVTRRLEDATGPHESLPDMREAILHTTDIVQKHAEHARNIVHGFRHGLYASNIDFHVGSMEDFFKRTGEKESFHQRGQSHAQEDSADSIELEQGEAAIVVSEATQSALPETQSPDSISPEDDTPSSDPPSTEISPSPPTSTYTPPQPSIPPFLSHIIIDTQSAHKHLELATKHLLPGGKIITFNPSITQIGECTELIKRLNLPLDPETVLELGQNISGGRVWDVRAITPRLEERRAEQARTKEAKRKAMESAAAGESKGQANIDALSDTEAVEEEAAKKAVEEQKFVMVCRPKVGKVIIGGGFVGVWRKLVD